MGGPKGEDAASLLRVAAPHLAALESASDETVQEEAMRSLVELAIEHVGVPAHASIETMRTEDVGFSPLQREGRELAAALRRLREPQAAETCAQCLADFDRLCAESSGRQVLHSTGALKAAIDVLSFLSVAAKAVRLSDMLARWAGDRKERQALCAEGAAEAAAALVAAWPDHADVQASAGAFLVKLALKHADPAVSEPTAAGAAPSEQSEELAALSAALQRQRPGSTTSFEMAVDAGLDSSRFDSMGVSQEVSCSDVNAGDADGALAPDAALLAAPQGAFDEWALMLMQMETTHQLAPVASNGDRDVYESELCGLSAQVEHLIT